MDDVDVPRRQVESVPEDRGRPPNEVKVEPLPVRYVKGQLCINGLKELDDLVPPPIGRLREPVGCVELAMTHRSASRCVFATHPTCCLQTLSGADRSTFAQFQPASQGRRSPVGARLGRLQRLRTVKWATRPPSWRTNWRAPTIFSWPDAAGCPHSFVRTVQPVGSGGGTPARVCRFPGSCGSQRNGRKRSQEPKNDFLASMYPTPVPDTLSSKRPHEA